MSKPWIAFVDDDVVIRAALRRLLHGKSNDWDMRFYEGGEEFLADCGNGFPTVSVLDMSMPGMTGLEIALELKSRGASTVAIMLTGNADLESAVASVNDAGVFRYYLKPCPRDTLVQGIEDALLESGRSSAGGGGGGSEETAGTSALNVLPIGALVVGSEGQAVFMNSSAVELLSRGEGVMVDAMGMFRITGGASATPVADRVSDAIKNGEALHCKVEREDGGRPLSVTVSPIEDSGTGTGRVIVFIADPDVISAPSPEAIGQLFGLTPAEARLVAGLVSGASLEEAAEMSSITINSARTYLKSIFSKTGVTRQAELVQMVLTSSAAYAPN